MKPSDAGGDVLLGLANALLAEPALREPLRDRQGQCVHRLLVAMPRFAVVEVMGKVG